MGLTMLTWAGLQAVIHKLLGRTRPQRTPAARAGGLHSEAGTGHVAWPPRSAGAAGKPLRVLRVVDAGQGPASAGRMVISGRLADVCAELDRLAALETAAA